MLLAALTHDIGHPGVNQDFLISTSNHLAHIHGGKSVLERHHCRTGRALLNESQLLGHLPASQQQNIFCIMNETILATDMARNKEFVTQFQVRQLCNRFGSSKGFIVMLYSLDYGIQ